jgi:hypothetical protein
MPEGRLVIGTKRYSSWSMRGWPVADIALLLLILAFYGLIGLRG